MTWGYPQFHAFALACPSAQRKHLARRRQGISLVLCAYDPNWVITGLELRGNVQRRLFSTKRPHGHGSQRCRHNDKGGQPAPSSEGYVPQAMRLNGFLHLITVTILA